MSEVSHETFNFKKMLYNEAKNIGLDLDDKCLKRLETYKDLLIEWNEKINLTAITDEYEVIMKHFIDSLELVKYIEKEKKVIDIGTGAGFPGLVISIYFDGKSFVTLVDALNKRINFLQEVIEKLKLNNIEALHSRAEEIGHNESHREKYDYAVSRAVAPLNILLEYDVGFVKPKGKCLLLKGNKFDEEISASKKALQILNCEITNIYEYAYIVGEENYKRKIIEVLKNNNTNNKYPRNYGKIKKNPL